MGIFRNRQLLSGVAMASLVVASSQALAGGFALREQSPWAQGEAFAGVAAGAGGISSMFWNPATLTKYQGWNSSSGFSLVLPFAAVTPTVGALTPTAAFGPTGNIGAPAVIPSSGGGVPNALFQTGLGMPTVWVPHSYPGCSQHAPDEHILLPVAKSALRLMAGLYWDLGEGGVPN